MERIAVFPGSFDPFTIGHLDIVKSALKLFDKLYIAVGYNMQKKGLFSVEQRIDIIHQSVAGLDNVYIDSYQGLTIDYCKKRGAGFIVRGLRTSADFEHEQLVAQANSKMHPSVTTLFIPCDHRFSFVTSSVVRDVMVNGGDITPFMANGVIIK